MTHTSLRAEKPRRTDDEILRAIASRELNKLLLKLGAIIFSASVLGAASGGIWVRSWTGRVEMNEVRLDTLEARDHRRSVADSALRAEMGLTRQEMRDLRTMIAERLPQRISLSTPTVSAR